MMKDVALKHDATNIIRAFPETENGSSVSGDWGSLVEYNPRQGESKQEWQKRTVDLFKKGRLWLNLPFFHKNIPELEKEVLKPLYSDERDNARMIAECFGALEARLRKIKQYYSLSRQKKGEKEFAEQDIREAVKEFNESLRAKLRARWKISSPYRPPFARKPRISLPVTVKRLPDFLGVVRKWRDFVKEVSKTGRPPQHLSVIVFHVVNKFTRFAYDRNRKRIIKDGKCRVRKHWSLILAALLWLHIRNGIPEIKTFLLRHDKEDANLALRKLMATLKKEYQNFRRSGKGYGKYSYYMPRGEEFLDRMVVLATEKGIGGRLI